MILREVRTVDKKIKKMQYRMLKEDSSVSIPNPTLPMLIDGKNLKIKIAP